MKKRLVKIGAIGSLFTAICCFTPALVWALSILGLSSLVAYLDYTLLPLLAIFLLLLLTGIFRRENN